MEVIKENLGKVAITVEKDYWTNTKAYDRLVIVELKGALRTFISRKPVPAGASIYDREYWIPFSSLQEEFVAQQNAWANRYLAKVESLEEQINDINNQVISYAPSVNNYSKDKEAYSNFKNAVFDFIHAKRTVVCLHLKAVNCTARISDSGLVNINYIEVDCNDPSCKDFVYSTQAYGNPVFFKVMYYDTRVVDDKLVSDIINEYFLVWYIGGFGAPDAVTPTPKVELSFYPIGDNHIIVDSDHIKHQFTGMMVSLDEYNSRMGHVDGAYDFCIQQITESGYIYVKAEKEE